MLSKALNYEQALQQLEDNEKMERRREFEELQKFHQQQKADKNAYEKMIDQLVADENEKQWNQREQQWRREDQARVNLLKNVYHNREADIELKKVARDEADWFKNYEKQGIENEVQRQNMAYE